VASIASDTDPWERTTDWDAFAVVARDFLAAEPERNTLPITVLEAVLSGRFRDGGPVFGWHLDGGGVDGAFLVTPPHDLIVVANERGAAALGEQLHLAHFDVPGVNAETATAQAFAAAYLAGDGRRHHLQTHMALYRLERLIRPPIPAEGSPRRAHASDFEVCVGYFDAMRAELGENVYDSTDLVRSRIEGGLIWLWEMDGGPVSLASRAPDAIGVARIGPVYTPPEARRQGFASAVTHACAKDALERGARSVVLFTDLDNPTSNSIYQAIGFHVIGERVVLNFVSA
jgi:ribosomal protein S18 acetylase RimI-like enzyme